MSLKCCRSCFALSLNCWGSESQICVENFMGLPDLFCEPTSSLAGCFLFFNHWLLIQFPHFLAFYSISFCITYAYESLVTCSVQTKVITTKQQSGWKVECECHLTEKILPGEFVTHWRQKISEITHIDNNMLSLWLSRLQLQPNSKARMDLHGQCKQLEIVKTDQV